MQMQKVLHLKTELEKKNPKLQGNYLVTEKIEGWYVTIHYDYATATWLAPQSSSNRFIPSMFWTTRLFNKLPKPKEDCFLIAEAYLEDTPFHILNGIFNRTKGDLNCKEVQFKIHDIVYPNNPALTAIERYNRLRELELYKIEDHAERVQILHFGKYDSVQWQKQFDLVTERGGEGIVCKRESGIYSYGKRNSDLLKLKLECVVDLLAVRLEQTVTEKGNLSLVLVSKRYNNIEVRTVINSKELQEKFIADSTTIIGKVVEIKAMEEFADGQLRQPTFHCIRHDKTELEID